MKIHSVQITGSKPAIIPAFSSDPSNNDIGDGSIWVNSSADSIKFSYQSSSVATPTWSAGGVKDGYIARVGSAGNSVNSALAFGGYRAPSLPTGYPSLLTTGTACTQEYNGTAWSDGGNMSLTTKCNTSRGGAGSQNAALAFGGHMAHPAAPSFNAARHHDCTEEYDGSSWSDATAALPHPRHSSGGVGTQNSAFGFGGITQPQGTSCYFCKEGWTYDGSAWTTVNNLTTARGKGAGFGGVNAAIAASSNTSPYTQTEEWDGTSWASGGSLSDDRRMMTGFGTQNSGVVTGGGFPSNSTSYTNTYTYDGSAWSDGPAASISRYGASSTGDSSNSGVVFGSYGGGGSPSPASNLFHAACTEEYVSSLSNTFVTKELVAKDGIVSSSSDFAMLSADGAHRSGSFSATNISASGAVTSSYFKGDGSALTNVTATLPSGTVSGSAQLSHAGFGNISGSSTSTGSFAKVEASKIGTSNSTVYGDGSNLTNVATSNTIEITGSFKVQSNVPVQVAELNSDPAIATLGPGSMWINKTLGTFNFAYNSASILDKTWSAGGNFIGDRYCIGGIASSANDSIVWGGKYGNSFGQCLRTEAYVYDGTAWTDESTTNCPSEHSGAAGTSNATYKIGGRCCGPSFNAADYKNQNEEYDGSSWSNSTDMQRAAIQYRGVGNQNSIIAFGSIRYAPNASAQRYTEGWDGSSWSICNDMVQSGGWLGGFGTTGAAVAGGGYKSPYACSEEWDGTSWATSNAINNARYMLSGGGTQNAGIVFGGHNSSNNALCTECYDGSTWSNATSLNDKRCASANAGTAIASLLAIGSDCSGTRACTEEWTEGVSNTMLVKQVTGSAHSY